MLQQLLTFIIIGLIFLFGLIPYLRDKKNIRNIIFFLFTVFLCLWILFLFYEGETSNISAAGTFLKLDYITAPIVVFFLLIFCLNFPETDKKILIKAPLIMILPLIFSLAAATNFVIQNITFSDGSLIYDMGILYYPYSLFIVAYLGAGALTLFIKLLKSSGQIKNQLLYIFTGFLTSSLFVIIFNVFVQPLFKTSIIFSRLGIWGMLFFVGLTAYAMTKTSLLDIRIVIGNAFAHGLAILLLAIGYLTLIFTYLALSFQTVDFSFILINLCYGIIIGEAFQKLKENIQTPVDRFFIKVGYDFGDVSRQIATKFRQSLTHEDIVLNINPILTDTVDIQNIRFFFSDPKNQDLIELSTQTKLSENDPLIEAIKSRKDTIPIPKNSELRGELCIPSLSEDKILALIVIGKKRSEDDFTEQDYDLFKTISEYIAVALEYIIKPYQEVQQQFEQTERKLLRAEKELYRSQKLASLGTLTAGVTHEIRNPLGVIRSGLELLPKKERDNKYLTEFRNKYIKHVDRIEGIVGRILGLAKDEKNKSDTICDINNIINETLNLIRFKEGIKITKELGENIRTKGIYEDIERIFINLFENANHAMPDGGQLNIKTYEKAEEDQLKKVFIEIADSGTGIPEQYLDRIFDPFFSSRHEGTGLGLPISYRIIKEHGGDIVLNSVVKKGTTFIISFNQASC